MSRLRPAPTDTLPHLSTEALLSGIRAGAELILERDVTRARSVETEEGMLLSSLLQYVECVEARLRPGAAATDRAALRRCPAEALDQRTGAYRRCELSEGHLEERPHRVTIEGTTYDWHGPAPVLEEGRNPA